MKDLISHLTIEEIQKIGKTMITTSTKKVTFAEFLNKLAAYPSACKIEGDEPKFEVLVGTDQTTYVCTQAELKEGLNDCTPEQMSLLSNHGWVAGILMV